MVARVPTATTPGPDVLGASASALHARLARQRGLGFFRIDAAMETVRADERFYAILRRPHSAAPVALPEVVGLFDPETAKALLGRLGRAMAEGTDISATHRLRLADGSVRMLEWEAVHAGSEGIAGALRDATDDVEAKNLLDGQKELIANLVDHLPLPVAILDNRLRYVAVNRRWIEDFAIDATEGLVGRRHYDLFPNTPTHWRELHHLALNGDRISRDLDEHDRGDGARMTVNWVLQPWRDKTGGIGGIVIMAEVLRLSRRFADTLQGDLASILFGPAGAPPPVKNPWLQVVRPTGDQR